ncbi:DUF5060 domain-containing protein, partial [candidate division KSB1 bacterium]|nr:DUF5060 domain-containing protein [candidate division KSB1 bacterium]
MLNITYNKIMFLWLSFLFTIVLTTAHAQSKLFDEKNGVQWSPVLEWTVKNFSYKGNPFDVDAKAVFFHSESGKTITTHLFYDENDYWKFRFTGTEIGNWTFRTYCEDEDLDGWAGNVVIAQNENPAAHGFMKAFGDKWGWQGSETAFIPQYVMGKVTSGYLDDEGHVDKVQIQSDIQEFVEDHGFTGFHIPVKGRWFDGENPDPRIYRVVEEIIQNVHAKGGACHIWLWGCDPCRTRSGPESFAGGAMSEIDLRNLRYLAARLGPIPGWSMGYGYDTENGWIRPEVLDEWKAYLESRMGYDHFLGARVGFDHVGITRVEPRPPGPPVDASNRSPVADQYTFWLGGDYTGYTSYRPLYPRYKAVIRHQPDKPSFEEDRFRIRDIENWRFKDYTPELTRRGLWHSAMAGGVANIWGYYLPQYDDDELSRPYPIKDQIKTYSTFFEHRFLPEMGTFYDGPELRLAVPDGKHAIIYRENCDIVRLNLQSLEGKQSAIAVDTKKPYKEIEIGNFAVGNHTWKAPYRSDWAIAVGVFSV